MNDIAWQAKAVCRDHDPDLFFPNPSDRRGVLDAMAVCYTCPVMQQCQAAAKGSREQYGVWGAKHFETSWTEPTAAERATPVPPAMPPAVTGHGAHNGNKTHCKRGHNLSGDNLYAYVRNGKTMRMCKQCNRVRQTKGVDVQQARAERRTQVLELSQRGYTVERIVRELGLGERMVRRDLKAVG